MTDINRDRLLRLREVMKIVPLSRTTIYARVAAGTFPRQLDLGGGVVAWREVDIQKWLAELKAPASAQHQ